MGEEGVVGGTARYVDSSLERLQIKVEGLEGTRFIACNGHALPLQPTGTRGEWVAGVRFRAWQPPPASTPIGIHSPLKVRPGRPLGRPLAGRLHLPRHAPAGATTRRCRSTSSRPKGAACRASRRGAYSGPMAVDEPVIHPEFPHTLDLRRFG